MTLRRLDRWLRYRLRAGRVSAGVAEIWSRQPRELARAVILVRVFYVCGAFMMLEEIKGWPDWAEIGVPLPLWPLAWTEWTGVAAAMPIILQGALLSVLAAALAPHLRVARAAAAIGLLLHAALLNSGTGIVITHGFHAWFWTAAAFIFLPSGSAADIASSRPRAQRYLRVLWAAQLALLMFYSMSGAFKIAGACWQFAHGQVHAFAPPALARHVAARLLEGAETRPYFSLGPWLVRHPNWGALIFPFTIYLESFSVLVAFRPALHRVWGAGLIMMHIGIFFFMTIMFATQIALVGLLLLASPFAPERVSMREVGRQLPVLGDLIAWLRTRDRRRPHPTPAVRRRERLAGR